MSVRESASSCKVSSGDDEAVIRTPAPSRSALGAVFDESTDHQHTMLLFGAYSESGILPGEEMEQIISTISVITSILYPERQTNVRECGARD